MRLLYSLVLFQLSTLSFGQTPTKAIGIDMDSLSKVKAKESIGKPFPKFVAADVESKITNDSLMGKVVLINFWFESCHPCLAEFDALNELARILKGNKDFKFISFSWDDAETIKRVKEERKLQFGVFSVDINECRRLNQNNGYPTTIILDRKGKIKYLVFGGADDKEEARKFVMTTLLSKIQNEF